MRDDEEAPLPREAIERYQNEIAKLAAPTVLESLRTAYIECAPKRGEIPSARTVQSFLAVWKVMWRWKRNAMPSKPQKVHEVKDDSPL